MTLITKIIFVFLVMAHFSSFVHAEVKNLNDVMSKATPQELKDLPKLLKQIRMKPSGNAMMTVTAVEKGSVYDREGIKIGDLISIAKSHSAEKAAAEATDKK
jgi:hypothetical protein